jgi:hypothetical protein
VYPLRPRRSHTAVAAFNTGCVLCREICIKTQCTELKFYFWTCSTVTCADIFGHVGHNFKGRIYDPATTLGLRAPRMGIFSSKPAITPPPELKRDPKKLSGNYEKLRASLSSTGTLLLPDDTGVRSDSLVPSSLNDCTMHGIHLRHNRAVTAHAPAIFHGGDVGFGCSAFDHACSKPTVRVCTDRAHLELRLNGSPLGNSAAGHRRRRGGLH